MKKTHLLTILLLCLFLSVTFLTACQGPAVTPTPPGPADDWNPKGESVTLLEKGAAQKYIIIYSATENGAKAAADSLAVELENMGLKFFSPTISTAGQIEDEILIGQTDRKASEVAKVYLAEKSASAQDAFNYVIYYRDGKLAVVANSADSYYAAILDLICNYSQNGSIVVKDNLKKFSSMNESQYDSFVANLESVLNEKNKEENAALADAVLSKLETQRDKITLESLFGTSTANIGTGEWNIPANSPLDEHPRLLITSSNLSTLKKALRTNDANSEAFKKLVGSTIVDDGVLPPAKYKGDNATIGGANVHNFDSNWLEIIQAKALAYLIYEDEYYGYQAILYMKNYLLSLDIQQIASDQCRQYGFVMFTAALVYDWCYDLLTDVDKEQLIAGVEHRICRMTNNAGKAMEVGFPPSGQGVVVGHGSERQILRDYLSFAVAIYGDNDSWWNYIGGRVIDDYIPARNYYFQSGVVHQGTEYGSGRHISDLYSDWILTVATGKSHYDDGIKTALNGFLGYEFAPGQLFDDGDGHSKNYSEAASFVSHGFILAYLYENDAMLAFAEHYWGDKAMEANISNLTVPLLVALRGLCELEPAADMREDLELIQFNGSPLGQYVIRAAWDDPSSAAVIMRIKERTTGNHEHGDSGTFEIYYKGMLTSGGGTYNVYGATQTAEYYRKTISKNGLIIFDSTKWTASNWYSGSQRRTSEPSTLSALLGSTFEMGVVTGREHGYSDAAKSQPLYAYIAGDITKAYDTGTVDYVGRRMLTVYTGDEEFPMAFFVYDDITSDKAEFKKSFLLQITSPNAPTVNAEKGTIITENGDGRLVLNCLNNDDVEFKLAGGRNSGKYSAKDSKNYLINGVQCVPNSNTADDGHWGRVEIVSTKNSKDASFMNLLYVTDRGNDSTPGIKEISGTGVTGGMFDRKIVALFATSRTRAVSELSCTVIGDGERSYYVSGVAAGEWEITVDGTSYGTATATEEGGLLTFTAPAGALKITPKK